MAPKVTKLKTKKPTTRGRKSLKVCKLYNRMPVKLRSGLPNMTVKPLKSSMTIIAAVLENNAEEIVSEDSEGDDDELPTRMLHIAAKNAFDKAEKKA
ncbi:hypothetical protein QE152_g4986 [Popillia japonica]|uniref:Uncharacterized protein n=1 Tax=Popillia japonica TaxID=7064 RepID=A0AAW1MZ95_POPJA